MVNPSMGFVMLGDVIVTPSPTPNDTGCEATPWNDELPVTVTVPELHSMLALTTLFAEAIVIMPPVSTCVCTFNEPIAYILIVLLYSNGIDVLMKALLARMNPLRSIASCLEEMLFTIKSTKFFPKEDVSRAKLNVTRVV